jgi:hypothetical protein
MKRTSGRGMKSLKNDHARTNESKAVGWFNTPKAVGLMPSYSIEPQGFIKNPSLVTLWSGIASVASPFGKKSFQRASFIYPQVSTWTALCGDWEAIGLDMSKTMDAFASKYPESFPTQGQLFDPKGTKEAS